MHSRSSTPKFTRTCNHELRNPGLATGEFFLWSPRDDSVVDGYGPADKLTGIAGSSLVAALAVGQVAPALGGWAGLVAAGLVGWRLRFRVSQDARNWQRGARGERRTARQLDRLTHHGWVVFHDLAIPDSRANADHLVIGPAGVFLVDSKNWRGHLAFAPDGTLWHGSYPLTATLATIGFEAQAIAGALAVPGLAVEPLLVVHGSTIPWGEQHLGGVAILPARCLVATLLALPKVLTDQQVTQLIHRAVVWLSPAAWCIRNDDFGGRA